MRIEVVMSTYNGEKNIERQLDSIVYQQDVNVSVIVRDDGSKDDTKAILHAYHKKHQQVRYVCEDNVGWKMSFLCALKKSCDADYYAYSDQDDVWCHDKLKKCVEVLEKNNNGRPAMIHCNRFSCGEDLVPYEKQSIKVPRPSSKKSALTQEYAQGCTIVMNKMARDLVLRHLPSNIPHDFWTGLICYFFGDVYYLDERLIYHIRYKNSQSTAGDIKKSRMKRVRKVFKSKEVYCNPAMDLLEGYSNLLTSDEIKYLTLVANTKHSLKNRLKIIFDPGFRRNSWASTILLKTMILLGKF